MDNLSDSIAANPPHGTQIETGNTFDHPEPVQIDSCSEVSYSPGQSVESSPSKLIQLTTTQRLLLFFAAGMLTIFAAVLLMTGIAILFENSIEISYPYFAGSVVILSIAGIIPTLKQVEVWGDKVFLLSPARSSNPDSPHSSEVEDAAGLDGIASALNRRIATIAPQCQNYIFIYDQESEQYAGAKIDGEQCSHLRFHRNGGLAQALSDTCPLNKPEIDGWRILFPKDSNRLEILGADVLIPIHGNEQLVGWVALGKSKSGKALSQKQVDALEKIAGQYAHAIERHLLGVHLETRMRQMEVLRRIQEGVNFTLTLDDIYELIYAQTTQILPADEFRIFLLEPDSKNVLVAFTTSGNERKTTEENQLLPVEQLPEYAAITEGKSFICRDYMRECRKLGCPDREGGGPAVWMAVPLRAGADTIGAVCAGQQDNDGDYTTSQQALLQAVADQAAGAIVKGRLLSESDKRTRQLRTLYDMTRQLTSTLDQELLHKNILQSAVEILGCQGGSLLMADEAGNQLVTKVTFGVTRNVAVDQFVPSDAGIAQRSFNDRQPVIENSVRNPVVSVGKRDRKGGLTARSRLVVPMHVKDRVLGVIEVINPKTGSGFSQDDQELLMAFAAHAAVAVENSRLYTMTDQALATRVEELSVMQQIDRELNTSLDMSRAMNITLEWAMRQSGASAGLIAMVEPDGVRLMASQGYGVELETYRDNLLSARKLHLDLLGEDGKPAKYYPHDEADGLLTGGKSQVVIPIQREMSVIGIILLESLQPEVCTLDALEFLTRLGDHASIAIANAQLYNAVKAANLAKSEFVSFVAHELKNPMTSIKGYTELLAARAVGPVTVTQNGFLQVIRSNIDRMNTLVSDLNDLTKIEAGRLRLDYSATALKEVVNEVQRSMTRQIEEKGQVFETTFAQDLPLVWCDRNRLAQILVNLVSNAQKYSQANGKITLGAEVLFSDNGCQSSGLHVWVQDNGIGITQDDQAKIFQKFFRSDDPKTREAPGAGLGLNITRSLVELQGGKIWFESEFRKGTTFHFTIPLAG